MYYSNTRTKTQTDTYTASRAEYVMGKAYEDLTSIYIAGLLTKNRADSWRADLLYLMSVKVLNLFEIQFTLPDGTRKAIRYKIKDSGFISDDNNSGGVDFYSLPKGTKTNLTVSPRRNANKYPEAMEELKRRGWGMTGSILSGSQTNQTSFSKENYGLNKSLINW